MTRPRLGVVFVGGLLCSVAACAVEREPALPAVPKPAAGLGTTSSAATQATFVAEDVRKVCNLSETCCGPQGYTIDQTFCRNLFTTFGGFQGELYGAPYFTGAGVAYDNAKANTCLSGIQALGCGTVSSGSYAATHQACLGVMTGTGAAGAPCSDSVECSATNFCDVNTTLCTPLLAVGDPCTSSDQCSYRASGGGCDLGTSTCAALLPNGSLCNLGSECASGLCDGTCTSIAASPFDPTNCVAFGGAPTVRTVSQIATSIFHTCALMTDGKVRCWGAGQYGALGNDSVDDQPSPRLVLDLLGPAVGVATGHGHSCALLADATVECWGNNVGGELGDGTTTSRLTPAPVVGLGGPVASIHANYYSTCAVLTSGAVECWGQLAGSTVPVPIANLAGSVESLAVGTDHVCAVLAGGTSMQCWGMNFIGAFCNGTSTGGLIVPAPGAPTALPGTAVHATAGLHFTCLTFADGSERCCGANTEGALGDGTVALRVLPTPFAASGPGTSSSAGWRHACVRLANGTVECSGRNANGELGDGSVVSRTSPGPVSGLANAVAVSVSDVHSCALLSDASVACWGDNTRGKLGDGTTTNSLTPVAVVFP